MIWLLTEIFYLLTLVALVHEFGNVTMPAQKFSVIKKTWSIREDKDATAKWIKENKTKYILHAIYFVWSFVGLLSPNWLYFAALLIVSLLIGRLRRFHWIVIMIDGIISVAILFSIMLAHYHNIHLANFLFPFSAG